ncbi:Nodulin MtN21 /EamA-like transporter family protein, putative isoform 1 [Hibiscus syriacus]|uniref:Nodulin MtN21 /EamA-like transporter family protein, putative isoform 1 n=1 Tax=Hibiscus syriacus TaxID=106335 RepID=A0A6A3BNR5_HIBSY|nr:Nodulin MtN21 /EamA-like transporter family protein, putative isoform 1 [Hibiscus syriacus]
MTRRNELKESVLPSIAIVAAEFSMVAINVLAKAASLEGMSFFVFTAYCQLLVYKGLELSSPTLASAINNLIPAFTFILAVFFSSTNMLAEPNLSSWRLSSSLAVVAVLYSGLVGFSILGVVKIWGVRLKGPAFVVSFRQTSIVIAVVMSSIFLGEVVFLGRPLSIVIAAFLSAIFLGDALHLGSVIGAVILSMGFYAVIWGKAKDERIDEDSGLSNFGQLPYNKLGLVVRLGQVDPKDPAPFLDPSKLESVVKSVASKQEPLALSFSSIGAFPNENNLLFLSPAPTMAILQFQAQLSEAIKKEGIEVGEDFKVDSWIPYCPVVNKFRKQELLRLFVC